MEFWATKVIDVLTLFAATFSGVTYAVYLDKKGDRAITKKRKRKLADSLISELEGLKTYVLKHRQLIVFQDCRLPIEVIDETIKEQLELFSDSVNEKLKRFRKELSYKKNDLEKWTQLNNSRIGKSKYPDDESAHLADKIISYWQTFVINIEEEVEKIRMSLKKEIGES